jgi:hypothetical protein
VTDRGSRGPFGEVKMPHYVMAAILSLVGYKVWFPGQTDESRTLDAKLAPLYQTMNDLRVTLGEVDKTLQFHTIELQDHEQRLRAAEQWPKALGKPTTLLFPTEDPTE